LTPPCSEFPVPGAVIAMKSSFDIVAMPAYNDPTVMRVSMRSPPLCMNAAMNTVGMPNGGCMPAVVVVC
jgi:hypothetical protein